MGTLLPLSLGSLIEMGTLLPRCTCTHRIGQVLADSCTDGVDILFAGFGLCTSQSWFERIKGCLCYQKDILDYCPNSFDAVLQVLVLKNRTKAASRARTGYGSNQ